RGSQRKQDMGLLFSAIGQHLSLRPDWLEEEQAFLRHVVIHAYSPGIMRAAERILRDIHPVLANPMASMKRDTRIARACRLVTQTNDAAVYEVWAWRKLACPTSEGGQLPTVIGYVTIQLLPRWLTSYRSESKERLKASRGWFVENFLPYVRPPQEAVWRPPVTPFLRGYNWAELGL